MTDLIIVQLPQSVYGVFTPYRLLCLFALTGGISFFARTSHVMFAAEGELPNMCRLSRILLFVETLDGGIDAADTFEGADHKAGSVSTCTGALPCRGHASKRRAPAEV